MIPFCQIKIHIRAFRTELSSCNSFYLFIALNQSKKIIIKNLISSPRFLYCYFAQEKILINYMQNKIILVLILPFLLFCFDRLLQLDLVSNPFRIMLKQTDEQQTLNIIDEKIFFFPNRLSSKK